MTMEDRVFDVEYCESILENKFRPMNIMDLDLKLAINGSTHIPVSQN